MSRPNEIWLRKQTGWWMTTINGVQHKLAKDGAKAQKAFYKLMAREEPAATRPVERHSVNWLCNKFLDRTKAGKTAATFDTSSVATSRRSAKPLAAPDSLKVHEVNEWLDQTAWSGSTKALVVTIVKTVFNRGVGEHYLAESPMKKLIPSFPDSLW